MTGPERDLVSQVAIVTGGGWNIGRAIALRLARAGSRVVVAARREGQLREVVSAIERQGGEALAVPTDVTLLPEVERLVQRTLERFGTVDILVACAGGGGAYAAVDAVRPEEWTGVVARNLFGTFHCARAVLPVLRAKNSGLLVTLAGGGAFFPLLGHQATAYAAAKAAICRFTDQLQAELLDTAIRVNCVQPGMVWSPERLREVETEEARTGRPHPERAHNRSPEDAAELVHFLASAGGARVRGRVIAVHDTWWRSPAAIRAIEQTIHLYRLRRVEEG
ncbi:MAG: SDR family oxidoreductase [Planctomycetota bacterium]